MEEKRNKILKKLAMAGIVIFLLSGTALATRQTVIQEALHALDQSNTNDINKPYDQNTKGNWNWLWQNGDAEAERTLNAIKKPLSQQCLPSIWAIQNDGSKCTSYAKPVSFYSQLDVYGYYQQPNVDTQKFGRGGQCYFFANLVVYRAGETGQKVIEGFMGYTMMIQTPDSRTIKYVRQGDVIFDKSKIEDAIDVYGNHYKKAYPYTVISINSGNSDTGTVTSVQARDRTGSITTISGSELDKYTISKYARGIEFAQPADIIFDTKSANGQDHTAVVVKITGGNSNDGSVSSLDVVDSNWCPDNCEEISYHAFSGTTNTKLASMFVYTGVSYYGEIWNPYNPVLFRYSDPLSYKNGRVYEIKRDSGGHGYARWIIDAKVFNDLFYDWNKIVEDKQGEAIDYYTPGENIVFRDGSLIDQSGTIYEMRNSEKHGFTSWESYVSHGYNANTPKTSITSEQANAIPTGIVMDYKLFTRPDGRVYVIQGNERKHVMDIDAFNIWGFSWSDVIAKSDAIIDSYTDRGELGHTRYGTIIEKNIPVYGLKKYFISINQNGEPVKRELRYSETLSYLDAAAKPVYSISDSEFNSIPEGPLYYNYAYQSPILGIIISDPNDCSACHIEPMTTPTPTPTNPPAPPPPTPTPTQPPPEPTPTPDPPTFDINQDSRIDTADLIIVANHFGELTQAPYPRYDVNQDGITDIYDIVLVVSNVG